MRPSFVALATLVIVALAAAPAAGAGIRTARFNVTLNGTYSTTGPTTETGCFTVDANDNQVPLPPQTGSATENTSFNSTRANAVEVSRQGRQRLFAGRLKFNRTLPLKVRAARSSTLGQGRSVKSCRPASANDPTPSDCGTKTRTFGADLYGARTGLALGFQFIRLSSFIFQPDDIFKNCSLGPAQAWFGFFDHAVANASPAKLFNSGTHTIVLTGKRSGRRTARDGASTGTATYSERYTLTLKRLG
jgi:hypothetical protein